MNSEYLFTKLTGKNKGEPLDADSVYSMLKKAIQKNGYQFPSASAPTLFCGGKKKRRMGFE